MAPPLAFWDVFNVSGFKNSLSGLSAGATTRLMNLNSCLISKRFLDVQESKIAGY